MIVRPPGLILPRRLRAPTRNRQGGFIVNPYNYAAAGPYLDGLATLPVCAHGMRKLVSTATLCMRVRNATTGVETDIGFVGDSIDTATLNSTFTGAQNVQVKTWYDQFAAFHFQQATVGLMPFIVQAGVNQNKIVFNGAQFMKATAVTAATPYWGVYSRRAFVCAATRVFMEQSINASGANPQAAFIFSNNGTNLLMYSQNGAGAARSRTYVAPSTMAQWTELFDRSIVGNGEEVAFTGGSACAMTDNNTTEQTGNFTTYDVFLGARGDSTLFSTMDITSCVQFNANSAAIRTSIENIVGVAP